MDNQSVADGNAEVSSTETSTQSVADGNAEVSSTETSTQSVADGNAEVSSTETSAQSVADGNAEVSSTETSAQSVAGSIAHVSSTEASHINAYVSPTDASVQSVAGCNVDVPLTEASRMILDDRKHFMWLSKEIVKDWRELGRNLDIDDPTIHCIEKNNDRDEKEMSYQMLLAWKNKNANGCFVDVMVKSLRAIDRTDIVTQLKRKLPGYHEAENDSNPASQDSFSQIVERLKKRCKALTMKGMPWRTDIELKLDKYHVEVTYCHIMEENGCLKDMLLRDIFKDSSVPKRIMIQGGPGSGKTTVANKLAYEWAIGEEQNFDLVLILSATDFAENFRHALIQAVFPSESDADELLEGIKDPSKKILLLIDDYERITANAERQLLPILRKEQFSHATVVVLSRSSKLTSSKGEFRQVANKTRCSGVDMTQFLDKHIVLKGLSDDEQTDFLKKHIQDVSNCEKEDIFKKVKEITDLWYSEYTQYPSFKITPLELLLLTVLFTKFRKDKLSLTTIHSELFSLMVDRYLSKEGLRNSNKNAFYDAMKSDVVEQFGQFAVRVLSLQKYPFSIEEILTTDDSYKVLDFGFVIEVLELDGIEHKLLYTPFNYALVEFAAAKHFNGKMLEYPTSRKTCHSTNLLPLRPCLNTNSPLWFSFLVGLLGNEQTTLFRKLEPYGAEYSHYFGSLCYSMLETPIKGDFQSVICPLLPVLWNIPWKNNVDFSNSDHHAELLRCGIDSGKIKLLRWDVRYSAKFSINLEVERLILNLIPDTQAWSTRDFNLSCKELHCLISGNYDETADSHWDEILRRILQIRFKYISFEVKEESAHSLLPLICKEVLTGRLKDKEIRWMLCDIHEKKRDLIQNINRLLKEDKVGGVQVALCGQQKNLPNPGTYRRTSHVVNGNIVELITAAAQSKRLKRFVLINWVEHITIDLADLCHVPKSCGHDRNSCVFGQKSCMHSKKSWKWVQLLGIRVECTECPECPKSKIQSLDLTHAYLSTTAAANLMRHFKIKSLASSMALVTSADKQSLILKSLKGLDVKVDETVCDKKHTGSLRKLENLQILSITIASLDGNKPPLPLKRWIVGSHNFLKLKGIEIWGAEINPQLAKNIIKSVVECVMGTDSLGDIPHLHRSPSMPPLKLKLKYFLINLGQDENAFASDIALFVAMVCELKPILKQRLLPRLEIVCLDGVLGEMSTVKPNGCTSWVDVFPVEEGFHVRHDFWGMSVEGPFRSREIYNSCPGECNRFCISASKEAIND